jgi:hypothetical protein
VGYSKQEAANPGAVATEVVHPLATMTGSVKDSQLVAPTGSRGGATSVNLDMTIPQESGGRMDMDMMGAISGVGHNQVLPGHDRGVHRVPVISLVGNGADGEGQTVAGESAGGKGSQMASTEIKFNKMDGKKGLEISLAWKGPIQSSMVNARIS